MEHSKFWWMTILHQLSDVAVSVGYVPSVGYDPSSIPLSSSSRGMFEAVSQNLKYLLVLKQI